MLHLPDPPAAGVAQPVVVLGRGRSLLREALTRAAAATGTAIEAERARAAVETAAQLFVQQLEERRAFSRLLGARRPLATYAILACIVATFLLELQTGATSSTERLLEMGALSPPLVAAGQWWRLSAYSLLHGGVMHVAFNGYVLFALGALIERLLGTARFLVLYCVSGLVAAAGSLALSGSVSVGASGAIWGLLGALGALAFGPSQILPPSVRRSIQRATLINLVINTAASFLPFIDWAAHFAGGAAGAVLVFSKICLPPTTPASKDTTAGWTLVAGSIAACFFGAGVGGVLGLW
jgi:rhomboid protease GluP